MTRHFPILAAAATFLLAVPAAEAAPLDLGPLEPVEPAFLTETVTVDYVQSVDFFSAANIDFSFSITGNPLSTTTTLTVFEPGGSSPSLVGSASAFHDVVGTIEFLFDVTTAAGVFAGTTDQVLARLTGDGLDLSGDLTGVNADASLFNLVAVSPPPQEVPLPLPAILLISGIAGLAAIGRSARGSDSV